MPHTRGKEMIRVKIRVKRQEAAMLNYACKAGQACKGWRWLYSCIYGGCDGQWKVQL